MMRRPARTRPGGAAVIMALRTDVYVLVVLTDQRAGGGDKIIVCGSKGIIQLVWIAGLAVRLVTVDTLNAVVGVPDRQRFAFEHRPARRTGVTPAATVNAIGRVHILNHL